MASFQPPEGLLDDLPFDDLKKQLEDAIDLALNLLDTLDKLGVILQFLPGGAAIKTALEGLIQALTVLKNFLDKTP